MKCFNCGCDLSEKEFCTGCGADVGIYKKIMYASNRFYNDGLAKANVRDLTGAIVSLRQSLKFNKNNVEARNLLGLVYFEMGEVVEALSEWVISKNIRSKKNIADDYINELQSNPTKLDNLNQTIKKYNRALAYCYQDSNDLAVIQLKKVLSMNPNMLKAHQLLALLYINGEEWEKARRELLRCTQIDANNTTTLQYLKEVKSMLEGEESAQPSKKKKGNIADEVITYQSGNETIIQPLTVKEPKVASTVLNIIIGIVIGVAAVYFLVLPASVRATKEEMTEATKVISDNLDAKTVEASELQQRVDALQEEKQAVEEELAAHIGDNGTVQATDALMQAAKDYLEAPDDLETLQEVLLNIDEVYIETEASDAYKQLYYEIMESVGPEIASDLYDTGRLAFNQSDYTKAIENLEKAWYFDKEDVTALYQLAEAYRMNEDTEKARETYQKVIELFPDTESAAKAEENLEE